MNIQEKKEILSLIIKNQNESEFNIYEHYSNPIPLLLELIEDGYLDSGVLIKTMTSYVVSLGGPHCITSAGRELAA